MCLLTAGSEDSPATAEVAVKGSLTSCLVSVKIFGDAGTEGWAVRALSSWELADELTSGEGFSGGTDMWGEVSGVGESTAGSSAAFLRITTRVAPFCPESRASETFLPERIRLRNLSAS